MRRKLPATAISRAPGAPASHAVSASACSAAAPSLTRDALDRYAPPRRVRCRVRSSRQSRAGCESVPRGRLGALAPGLRIEFVPQRLDPLWAEPGNGEESGDRRRHLLPQPVEQLAASSPCQLLGLSGQVGADARQPQERLAAPEFLIHVAPAVLQRPRRVAVGAYAKRIGTLDLEAIGDFLERSGDPSALARHWFESYSGRSCAHCPAQETAHLDARQTRLSASPACPNRRGAAGVDFTHPAAVPARAARRPRSPKRGGAPNASFRADGSA